MILFRKEAEKILRDHGFSEDITVSRIDRHIWLVGKCGKQIMQVSDLEVGNKLTKAERELLIEDYLYPNVIIQKAKIDKLSTIEQDINNIQQQLVMIEKEDKVYIDKEYSYVKAQNIIYITIKVGESEEYVAKLRECLETQEKYVHMNNVPQDKTCDIYNELLSKLPIRDEVFDLHNKKLKLYDDSIKLKKELKILC